MIKKLLLISSFCLMLFTLFGGCGGGTRGSGGEQVYYGFVQSGGGQRLTDVSVTILQTGDTSITNNNGEFNLVTIPVAGTVDFILESKKFSGRSSSKGIPQDATKIFVSFSIGDGNKPDIESSTEVKEREPKTSEKPQKNPTNVPHTTSTSPTPTDGADTSSTPTPTPIASATPTEDSGGSGNTGGGQEDQTVEAEGQISSVSTNSVVVEGKEFTPTSQTEYRGKHGDNLTIANFSTGDEVKAKGHRAGTSILLDKLEKK